MSSWRQITVIARKEYGDAVRNRIFLVFLFFLIFLIGTSIVVSAYDFQGKDSAYETALRELQQSGQTVEYLSAPQFFPLQLLRGSIEYLEIIAAVLATVLGYLSIAREKGNGTLQLLLTRPVKRSALFLGKLLGNSLLLASITGALLVGIYLALALIGKTWLANTELLKLAIAFVFPLLYLVTFFCIAMIITLLGRTATNALIICFVVWIMFVLIVPQIGDTLDPDNQVPGGLFNSLHVEKPDQLTVLAGFTTYERVRDDLEQVSLTKHFERLEFAYLGVKDTYNEKPIGFLFKEQQSEIWWLVMAALVSSIAAGTIFTRKTHY
ncbi:MAG: ABC transporter permease subunit [Thermoleophilia bacterium]